MKIAYSFVSLYSFLDALEKAPKNTKKKNIIMHSESQNGLELLIFDIHCIEEIKWLQFSDVDNSKVAICFWEFEFYANKMSQYTLLKPYFSGRIAEGIHIIPSANTMDFKTLKNTNLKGIIICMSEEWIKNNPSIKRHVSDSTHHRMSLQIPVKKIIEPFFLIQQKSISLPNIAKELLEYITTNKILQKAKLKFLDEAIELKKIEQVINLLSSDVYSLHFNYFDTASIANLEYEKLKKIFFKHCGINMYTFRQIIRMQKAFEYLKLGLKKNEIAVSLGYKGRTNQFTYHFKKIHGYPPESSHLKYY